MTKQIEEKCAKCGKKILKLTKFEKLFNDVIEKYIIAICESLIAELKPEIKEKVVFRFSDEVVSTGNENEFLQATNQDLNPNVITIYSNILKIVCHQIFRQQVKDVITHELLHCFTRNEKETDSKVRKVNFFKDEKVVDEDNKS